MSDTSAFFDAISTVATDLGGVRYVACSGYYYDSRPPNTTSSRRRGLTVTTRKCPDILEIRYTPFFVSPSGDTQSWALTPRPVDYLRPIWIVPTLGSYRHILTGQ